jgi:hypothetical protein
VGDMIKEELIDKLVDKYYYYPSKFNVLGLLAAKLSGRLKPEDYKKYLKEKYLKEQKRRCWR